MLQLYTVAHECGHIFLHNAGAGYRYPAHVMELEAESYAHQAFRAHGMELPRKFTQWGRTYVGSSVEKDRAAGIPIDPRAVAYAAGMRSPYEPLRMVPETWHRASLRGWPVLRYDLRQRWRALVKRRTAWQGGAAAILSRAKPAPLPPGAPMPL
jgi:hypothetical protein